MTLEEQTPTDVKPMRVVKYPGDCLDIVGQILGPIKKGEEAVFLVVRCTALGASEDGKVETSAYVEEVLYENMYRESEEMKGIYSELRADSIKAERGVDIKQLASLNLPPAFRKSHSIEDMLAGSV